MDSPIIQRIIALRRSGMMSLKRPAAGGESCRAGFYFTELIGDRTDRTGKEINLWKSDSSAAS